jgi:hypothetical protein
MMRRRKPAASPAPAGWGSYRSTRTYEVSPPVTWDNADEIAEWCASKPDSAARVTRDHPKREVKVYVGFRHAMERRHPMSSAAASAGLRLAYETTPGIDSERWQVTGLARMELLEGGAS